MSLGRAFLDGIWPEGSIWRPAPDLDLDHLLDGMAGNIQSEHDFLAKLCCIRSPQRTFLLDDLEREYGITKNDNLTVVQRVAILSERKYNRQGTATVPNLQYALDLAGFGAGGYGLTVYDNNGGANPSSFVAGLGAWNMYAGATGLPTYAGNTLAFARFSGAAGTLIVNGLEYTAFPDYYGAGLLGVPGYGYAGNSNMFAGYYTSLKYTETTYDITTDSNYWKLFFFLGKGATYSAGVLQTIDLVNIPSNRKSELYELILRYKSIFSWAILMANWI